MKNAYQNRITLPVTPMESNFSDAPMGARKTEKVDSRLIIAITSYRWGKHDPDGVSIKAVLDGLIRARLLRDDSTEYIQKICYRSIKTKKKSEEKTIIDIYADGENCDAWC